MTENLTKLLVTKLSTSMHEKLKILAEKDRRTLSGMSRIILEDYLEAFGKDHSKEQA